MEGMETLKMLYELADCQPEVICLDDQDENKPGLKSSSIEIAGMKIAKKKKTPLPSTRNHPILVDLSNSSEKRFPSSDTSNQINKDFHLKPKRPFPQESAKKVVFRKKPRFAPRAKDLNVSKKDSLSSVPLDKQVKKFCQPRPVSPKLGSNLSRMGISNSVIESCAPAKKLKFSRKHRPRDVLREIKSSRLMIDLDGNREQPIKKLSTQDLRNEYVKRVMTMGAEKSSERKRCNLLPSQVGRIVVFDTETTGFSNNDCIVEIGAVELINGEVTGVQFHSYVNAPRRSHPAALKVHGLTPDFLSKYRRVGRVLTSFFDWVNDARLIAHNAAFDVRMINAELGRLKRPPMDLSAVFCSAAWYRSRYKGRSYKLNAVCKHLNIDTSHRTLHGALLDALLTAQAVQKLWHHSVGLEERSEKNTVFVKKRNKK